MSARIPPPENSHGAAAQATAVPAKRPRPAKRGGEARAERHVPIRADALAQIRVPKRPITTRAPKTPRPEGRYWRVLCLCEIANFTTLRRHLGRQRADRLVLDVATRVTELCPDVRVSSAGRAQIEFAFERDAPEHAAEDIDRIRQSFLRPVLLDGEAYALQMEFGVAAAPGSDSDDVRLAEAAESALEQSQREGKVVMLDLTRADLAFDKLTLMRELPRAIAAGEMFLQYQPKVHMRRQEIASAEALVRWQHPVRGLILPGDFISVAEEAGEISALTIWTLRKVIEDQQMLASVGHDITLFINIAGVLLTDAGFVTETCDILATTDAKIGFEITETSVIRDPESAIRHLQTFADKGVALAIDDYGAGLSSLAYLKQLPATELKIDKMFVTQLTSSNRDPLIVRSTIDLAHALEMEVTAEGVETPSALALLSVMGCDMVQGFLISRPIGIDALRQFLADQGSLFASGGSSSFIRPESFWKRA
jgi:EAL domain-containing protein (putative c-di-GMP-specific phosphodiesterase class I)/GGDEF domain-containing protein